MLKRSHLPAAAVVLSLAYVSFVLVSSGRPAPPPDFPAGDVPRFEALVSPVWLKALIGFHQSNGETPRPASYHNNRFVILEASWSKTEDARDYLRGHIPGAVHFNTDDLETGYPTWKLRPPEELQQVIGHYGITGDTTVVVYSRQLIAAARVWWVLKYAGVADVRLLDGGFEFWSALGYPRETTVQTQQPAEFQAPVQSQLLATTSDVRNDLGTGQVWLADARSAAEYSGRSSGYSYLDRAGRIPSAVSIGNADDASLLYKRRDGRLRLPPEILDLWNRQGIVSTTDRRAFDRDVIFYCGGGWRSSLAFFYAWLLGFENIRNYSDGWAGWSTDYIPDASAKGSTPGWIQRASDNPVASGAP